VAEPINLNKARKARAKAAGKAQAAENRVKFGQPRAAKTAAKIEAQRARRDLDGKHLVPPREGGD
jgi:hypothetical protein